MTKNQLDEWMETVNLMNIMDVGFELISEERGRGRNGFTTECLTAVPCPQQIVTTDSLSSHRIVVLFLYQSDDPLLCESTSSSLQGG